MKRPPKTPLLAKLEAQAAINREYRARRDADAYMNLVESFAVAQVRSGAAQVNQPDRIIGRACELAALVLSEQERYEGERYAQLAREDAMRDGEANRAEGGAA